VGVVYKRQGMWGVLVWAESVMLTFFDEKNDGTLKTVGRDFFAAKAHTIAVDSSTHRVYLPLENIDGKPVLRIAEADPSK
jgi:hypothetical protein